MADEVEACPNSDPQTPEEVIDPYLYNDVGIEDVSVLQTDIESKSVPQLEELYQKYYRHLGRLAYLLTFNVADAEDVVAEVFLNLTARSRIDDIENPIAFLRTAVINRSTSVLRRRSLRDKYLPSFFSGSDDDTTADIAIQSSEHIMVLQALKSLPIKQRQAIALRYYADLSEVETAETMGVRPGTVKSHVSRGMNTLRSILGQTLLQR